MSDMSFFLDDENACPICGFSYRKEVVRTGGGRFIAEACDHDLYRHYKKTKKFGEVFPLIYSLLVCPNCYSAFYKDDKIVGIPEAITEQIKMGGTLRRNTAKEIFGTDVDFQKPRDLMGGVISYYYAINTYAHLPMEFAPTFKRAVSALRASWLIGEIVRKQKEDKDFFSDFKMGSDVYWNFRILARELYYKAYLKIDTYQEPIEGIGRFGPDIDKDYGFMGFIYVMASLFFEQRNLLPPGDRESRLSSMVLLLSRAFGLGQGSREKPNVLLQAVKDLVLKIKREGKE